MTRWKDLQQCRSSAYCSRSTLTTTRWSGTETALRRPTGIVSIGEARKEAVRLIDDEKIIEMFFERSEQGIRELDIKYGKVCHNLSYHIVGSRQDAEECVNDAYTLYCREWLQFLILLVEEFGCFLLITAGTVIVEAVEWFSGWIAEL